MGQTHGQVLSKDFVHSLRRLRSFRLVSALNPPPELGGLTLHDRFKPIALLVTLIIFNLDRLSRVLEALRAMSDLH
jgi:hypothetical protein